MILGKEKYIITALLCASVVIAFGGCKATQSGGKTDKTDYSAPKAITSDEISGFCATFFLSDRWTASGSHDFCFRIQPDENGVLTVYEDVAQISFAADSDILKKLQAVIAENNLADMNGTNITASSLAPGYQRCSVEVDYASGEKLQFSAGNNPRAQWANMMYDLFAGWFAEKGNTDLYPPKETSPVERFTLKYKDEHQHFRYRTDTNSSSGEKIFIEKTVYDISTGRTVSVESVAAADDYGKVVAAILDSYGLVMKYDFSRYDSFAGDYGNHDRGYYGMGTRTAADEKDADSISLDIQIKYQSGKTVNISTAKPSEIEGMQPLLAELTEYHSSLL